jgi:hypothetical protein
MMNEIICADCLEVLKSMPDKSVDLDDLQAGKAGEYLVCADLILKGYVAFPSEQGLPFDVVLAIDGKLYKIQVKTTRTVQAVPQRKNRTEKYIFHIRRCGKCGRQSYKENDVDIFAIVALDTKTIGYLKADRVKQTMFFLPENGKALRATTLNKISDCRLEQCLK